MTRAELALEIVAVYFGINLLLALAWGVKSLLRRRERRRREMHAFFDEAYRASSERQS